MSEITGSMPATLPATGPEVVETHRAAGRSFTAAGVTSFVLDQGQGPPVVCLHGVPTSSFLYRKVVAGLAANGLRGVAFDFPGTGLAERPADFDYSWTGLATWVGSAIEALGIERCHLLVHDIGGPIGFEWAIRHPDRVLSITALDTVVDVGTFHPPWPMRPFLPAGVGETWLALMRRPTWRWLFRREGVADRRSTSAAEIDAYLALLKGEDGGRALLKIMRGFELTAQKERFYDEGLAARPPYPTQVVWARGDRMLRADRRRAVEKALGVSSSTLVPGRHFLQEEQAPALVAAVVDVVREADLGRRP
jgi:pimeloyl-ACP methyl ester carboxylesterase